MVYLWLIVTVISTVIEFVTNEMLSIWFAGGGLVAIVLSLCNVPWQITAVVFFIVSLLLLIFFRKTAMKYLLRHEERTNAQSVIDEEFVLLTDMTEQSYGTIKIADVIWNVQPEDKTLELKKGEKVKIVSIKGNKYIVKKAN